MANSLTNWFKNKIIFVNNSLPAINANNLNKMQENIEQDLISALGQGSVSGMPVGSGCDFFGTVAPQDYMFADGTAISRTEYAALFALIGTTYGEGDGETTFNLPDKRERVSVMYKEDSTNGTDGATLGTLGAKGGEFKHTQTVDELATHTHIQNPHNHSVTANGEWQSGQARRLKYEDSNKTQSINLNQTTATNQDAGKSTPMNIMQPYLVCNYIIKVK